MKRAVPRPGAGGGTGRASARSPRPARSPAPAPATARAGSPAGPAYQPAAATIASAAFRTARRGPIVAGAIAPKQPHSRPESLRARSQTASAKTARTAVPDASPAAGHAKQSTTTTHSTAGTMTRTARRSTTGAGISLVSRDHCSQLSSLPRAAARNKSAQAPAATSPSALSSIWESSHASSIQLSTPSVYRPTVPEHPQKYCSFMARSERAAAYSPSSARHFAVKYRYRTHPAWPTGPSCAGEDRWQDVRTCPFTGSGLDGPVTRKSARCHPMQLVRPLCHRVGPGVQRTHCPFLA